jgi:hypothetical protein
VDGCPFTVANQQWRSVFGLPIDSEDWFSDQGKKTKKQKKDETTKKTKSQTQKKEEKLQDPLEMMIHGLHIQEHERAKKTDLKIMFKTWMMGLTTTKAKSTLLLWKNLNLNNSLGGGS